MHFTDSVQQQQGRAVFQQVTRGPGLHALYQLVFIVCEAAQSRDVYQVGTVLCSLRDCLDGVRGFAPQSPYPARR